MIAVVLLLLGSIVSISTFRSSGAEEEQCPPLSLRLTLEDLQTPRLSKDMAFILQRPKIVLFGGCSLQDGLLGCDMTFSACCACSVPPSTRPDLLLSLAILRLPSSVLR